MSFPLIHPLIIVLSTPILSASIVLYAVKLHDPSAYYMLPPALWFGFIYVSAWRGWFNLDNPALIRLPGRLAIIMVLLTLSVFFLQAVFRENTARRILK